MIAVMHRTMIAFAAFAASYPADAADRRLTVTDFDRVQVQGPYVVTLATGQSPSAVVTGSNEAIERVSVDVQGRILRVRPNPSAWGGYPGESVGGITIALSTHDLRAVSVTGSGSLTVDKAGGLKFDVGASGSAKVAIGALDADALSLGLLGSGRITLAGKAKSLKATISGSGDLDAAALAVDDADLQADTSGNIGLAVRRAAKVHATGAGDVVITGKPACAVDAPGAGRVRCGS